MRGAIIALLSFIVVLEISCKHEPIVPDFGETFSQICDPDTVYFVNDILPLINANCAQSGCHDAATATRGIILANYDALMNSGVVKPGDAENSQMFEAITEDDLRDMMPPPSTMIDLSEDQINMIETWIDQGARNNACADLVCDSMNISFSNHILPLIEQRCKGCHLGTGSIGGFPLTNYEQISNIAGYALYEVINHDSGYIPMPLNLPKLDSCKLQLVRVWIEEGALNN